MKTTLIVSDILALICATIGVIGYFLGDNYGATTWAGIAGIWIIKSLIMDINL